MNTPRNGNLRALGLSLNVPLREPSLQEGHTSAHDSQDDGYYYDAGSERFDGEENYYDYSDEGYSDDAAHDAGTEMTMWQDRWELDPAVSFNEDGSSLGSVVSIHQGAEVEGGGSENSHSKSAGSASSRPVIHPALIEALNKHVGQDTAGSVGSSVVSSASNVQYRDANANWDNSNNALTKNTSSNSLMDNSVSNLLIASPIKGQEQAILAEKLQGEQGLDGSQNNDTENDWKQVQKEISGTKDNERHDNKAELMLADFESIVPPPDLNPPDGANATGELREEEEVTTKEEDLLPEGHFTGEIKEAAFPDEADKRVNVQDVEGDETFDERNEQVGDEIKTNMFIDEEETLPNSIEIGIEESGGDLGAGKDLDNEDQYYKINVGSVARDSAIDLEIEADFNGKQNNAQEELESSGIEDTSGQDQTKQIELEENAQSNALSTAEIEQGTETNDVSDESSFAGFDEDFSSGHIDISQHVQPPDASESHVATNTQNNNNYTGDGFTYHVLQPKSRSHGTATSGSAFAIATAIGIFLCFCGIRYKRRHGRHSRPNRSKYSAIGGDEFFNGTFSDDISFNGKESDDDMSFGSDEGDGIRIELGGIHETEANGGLTLEEING